MEFNIGFELVPEHENQITGVLFQIRFRANPQVGFINNNLKGFKAFGMNALSVGAFLIGWHLSATDTV